MNPFLDQNRRAWNTRARLRLGYVDTATAKDFERPLAVADPCGWLGGDVRGRRLLCLAAGGGRHGPLFAAAGARVTVVDLSPEMLELDRQVAAERGLRLQLVEAPMHDLSALPEAGFDVVFQPVSTCYVPEISAVYQQVARVTFPGGLYISQHKQPASLQGEFLPEAGVYGLTQPYFREGPLPPAPQESWHREAGTVEYLHRWDQLLGGLCQAGFVIENVAEPRHAGPDARPGSFRHRSLYLPPYIKIKARRIAGESLPQTTPLWTP